MFAALVLLAEEGAKQEQQPGGLGQLLGNPIVVFPVIILLFYLFILRPMRRQESQRQLLIANTKKGDKVVTNAGIIGTVVNVAEKEDEITIKVDDNVRLKFLKGSIARNVTQEEAGKAPPAQTEAAKT